MYMATSIPTVLFVPGTRADAQALQIAAKRGRIRRISRGLYTDDLRTPSEQIVARDLLAILGALYRDHYVSHSTAALLGAQRGNAYISGSGTRKRVEFPGMVVHRLASLPHPETKTLELDSLVATSLSANPTPATVQVSSLLQTVFEALSQDARQPDRTIPEAHVLGLIETLSATDRLRAERFARRNGFKSEWSRFRALRQDLDAAHAVSISRPSVLEVFFYHWRVGRIEELSGREYRFKYDGDWTSPITAHLPLERGTAATGRAAAHNGGAAYEGPGLPPFFENLLPEGWTEARLRAVHGLPRDDVYGLLRTTQKYLSNLTLRPEGFDASPLVLDHLDVRLNTIAPDPTLLLEATEHIGFAPDTRKLWLELRRRGATRLSGVRSKLPVHLKRNGGSVGVQLAVLRSTSTHILKFSARGEPDLVENEWATMELARRAGLSVASVRRVAFQKNSPFATPSLLVERFDIPGSLDGTDPLFLLEDAASLLSLPREEKYRPSLERVSDALREAELDDEGFLDFLGHAVFSWIVGNGDLHAKNISVLHCYTRGALGAAPERTGTIYSPLYDLLNTNLVIRDDLFALPVNGRANNLRAKDFLVLVERWGLPRRRGSARIDQVVAETEHHVEEVLQRSGLPDDGRETYVQILKSRIDGL